MAALPGRKADRGREPPTPITSRLLRALLDEKRLQALGTLNILDFGRAHGASLEFFNQFPCRLTVLDAADTLLEWSRALETRIDDLPSTAQMQRELSNLLPAMTGQRYDLVLLWDTLNLLHECALRAFAGVLRGHVTVDFRGHGFMLHKRSTESTLRHLGLVGADVIAVHADRPEPLYAHNRRVLNESFGNDLRIDQGVLHGDGRLEFVMLSGRGITPGR